MEPKTLMEIVTSLAELKAEDIVISRLQSIVQPALSELSAVECESKDPVWQLSVQFLHIQHRFLTTCFIQKRNTNDGEPEEELINLQEQVHFLLAIDRIRQFTLNLYLPKEVRGLTKCEVKMIMHLEPDEQIKRLRYCLEAYRKLFEFKILVLQSKLQNSVMEYIAGVFSYHFLRGDFKGLKDDDLFKSFNQFPTEAVFKSLLVIKGVPNLPLDLAKQVHLELLELTGEAGGFPVLCKTLLANVPSDETPTWKKSEVIAKIVGSKGHTKKFYRQVLQDCFSLYEASLLRGEQENKLFASTCIECMRQMFALPPAYQELRTTISNFFMRRFDQMTEPEELLSGTIIFERSQLAAGLYLNYMAFTGSSCTSLNSSILVPYLHIFFKLYSLVPNASDEKKYLQALIIFCLSNREKSELGLVLQDLLLEAEHPNLVKRFHPRIYLKAVEGSKSYSIQVGPVQEETLDEESLGPALVEILKDSNRNLLIYDVFVILLKLFDATSSDTNERLLLDAEEQDTSSCKQFYQKYTLIQALMELIGYKHFHNQLYENPSEILAFIKSLLTRNLEGKQPNVDLLEVVLSIFQEYLQRLHSRDDVQEILKLLIRYKASVLCGDQLKNQIDLICEGNSIKNDDLELTPFQNALSLCSDNEPYCKVYGTTLMIRLLKEREKEALANKHAILILALNNLKHIESYAFLNSVRLLIGLCDVLEADTIEAVIKEYQCTNNEMDFRLKVGEATIKLVDAIGPIAFKYRDQLINCFLHESKSPVDELRSSSLANLGNVCKILSYQVHNFFYEMFLVIKSAIETDPYLPVRRAAILVFSQLIEGIDNLLSFEEYLLPIYRFLKFVIETEKDDVTRLQAALALDHLNAKTKEFLSAANSALATGKLEKEIRIFGIKEQEAEERRLAIRGNNSILAKMLD